MRRAGFSYWPPDSSAPAEPEPDVCVSAAVLGAVHFGYRVVLATDALRSSSDTARDALLALYRQRFPQEIEAADTHTILASWNL